MRPTLLLLIALACCARPKPQYGGIYLGPSCDGESSPKLPVLRRSDARDTALLRTGEAGLVIIVDSSTSQRPLAHALIRIDGTTIGAIANDSGIALFTHMRDGHVRLRVLGMGFRGWSGEVSVRSGYRDMLELGLGAIALCFSADRSSTIDTRGATALWSDSRRTPLRRY
jgi:hypothetical protein